MAPSAAPGTHQRVQLVDEEHDVLVLGDLVHDRLEPLLELAPVLGAGDDGRHVEREDPMVPQDIGALPAGDEQRQPFDDGRLAHARLPDQHRVVLLPAGQDLHDPLDLRGPPDGRVQLALGGELGEVAAEVIQRRSLGLLFRLGRGAGLGCRGLRLRHVAAQQPQGLRARLLQAHARVGQHLGGDALLFPEQTQQEVLGAHVGVVQLPGLGHGQLQHLLGPRGVRQVGPDGGARFPLLDRLLDLLLDLLEVDVEVGQDRGGDAFALANQAQEDVLGAHVFVVQTGSLLPGHLKDLADPIGEIVAVHRASPVPSPAAPAF